MDKWLPTIGVLVIFALLFAGVNIGLLLLALGLVISVGMAVIESIDKRKKARETKQKQT